MHVYGVYTNPLNASVVGLAEIQSLGYHILLFLTNIGDRL